jgi:hypothetical protein
VVSRQPQLRPKRSLGLARQYALLDTGEACRLGRPGSQLAARTEERRRVARPLLRRQTTSEREARVGQWSARRYLYVSQMCVGRHPDATSDGDYQVNCREVTTRQIGRLAASVDRAIVVPIGPYDLTSAAVPKLRFCRSATWHWAGYTTCSTESDRQRPNAGVDSPHFLTQIRRLGSRVWSTPLQILFPKAYCLLYEIKGLSLGARLKRRGTPSSMSLL